MLFLRVIWAVVQALFSKKADLIAENLALRQQLIVLRRKHACWIGRREASDRAGSSS